VCIYISTHTNVHQVPNMYLILAKHKLAFILVESRVEVHKKSQLAVGIRDSFSFFVQEKIHSRVPEDDRIH